MSDLKVSKIENGCVIDHIRPGQGMKILNFLDIDDNFDKTVSLVMNVKSNKRRKKDIVKIEDKQLNKAEMRTVSVLAPGATLNIIENYKVLEKKRTVVPDSISGILRCPNPQCITNMEEPVETYFKVVKKEPITLKCNYCERKFSGTEICTL